MKKKFIFLAIISLFYFNVEAKNLKTVTLNKCVDGDTAYFNVDKEVIKTRFLAINTPESTNKIEKYGKEASKFTCDHLTNASTIEIEYDDNATTDKYGRDLVWVYIDGELLQKLLINEGLAEVKYLYADYEYTEELQELESIAKEKNLKIWSNYKEETNYYLIIAGVIILFVICIFSKTTRNKVIRKTKSSLKKEIKKKFN